MTSCGYLRIIAEYPELAPHLAARITRWAGVDAHHIETNTNGRNISIVIPEEIMPGKGPLRLIDGGPDVLVSAFKASRTKVMSVGPGDVAKPSAPGGPIISQLIGEDMAAAVVVSGPNRVNISWGDGDVSKNLLTGPTPYPHLYSHGHGVGYLITVTDTVTKLSAEAWAVPVRHCFPPVPLPPDPPPPVTPTISSLVPACTVGWSAGSATLTGTNLAGATKVFVGAESDDVVLAIIGRMGTTQLKVQWGEIETDSTWSTTMTVVTPAGRASTPFLVTQPGVPCA